MADPKEGKMPDAPEGAMSELDEQVKQAAHETVLREYDEEYNLLHQTELEKLLVTFAAEVRRLTVLPPAAPILKRHAAAPPLDPEESLTQAIHAWGEKYNWDFAAVMQEIIKRCQAQEAPAAPPQDSELDRLRSHIAAQNEVLSALCSLAGKDFTDVAAARESLANIEAALGRKG